MEGVQDDCLGIDEVNGRWHAVNIPDDAIETSDGPGLLGRDLDLDELAVFRHSPSDQRFNIRPDDEGLATLDGDVFDGIIPTRDRFVVGAVDGILRACRSNPNAFVACIDEGKQGNAGTTDNDKDTFGFGHNFD